MFQFSKNVSNKVYSQFFQKELPARAEADPETLLNAAYNIKYNTKKMKKLEKEYLVIKSKEQEEMVELRVSTSLKLIFNVKFYLPRVKK